ncbi:hypothetical protein BU14_2852s0001 [Porphyra umbilicalis]|uniref:Uncharacterized protein n=1 Tax=Porphyra umbilicalis TaxID=2786 RepID=A0A1X6NIG9_PORUM|nr:hypothetical protein BU14_2852s0001 [Porphyra umbilicalis]|eukprot:OSX68409.1 hypothetical protein BU14_2852s0001 [Porphyra umbilicalis]
MTRRSSRRRRRPTWPSSATRRSSTRVAPTSGTRLGRPTRPPTTARCRPTSTCSTPRPAPSGRGTSTAARS